jgi:murein DD-endopeptidase MepM/ murein hydrolase activator NlpD
MRKLLLLVVVLAAVASGAWLWAGRAEGPRIELRGPERFIGQATPLDVLVESPGGEFSRVEVTLEQGGRNLPVFTLEQPSEATVKQETAERIYIMRPVGKRDIPELQAGPARIVVRAARPVLYGMRQAESEATRDVEVRLDPPRVAILSTFHFVNHGGAEFVVFRATPPDVSAGVKVGELTYPAFAGSSVGIADPSVRVAFFVLNYDQDLNTPVSVFARDPAGNEATGAVDRRQFPKPFAKSRIEVDDRFLQRVVPAIAQTSPGAGIDTNNVLQGFLKINNDLRRQNNQAIAALSAKTKPEMLWREAFSQLGNTAVESRFADYRTYFYQGKEIDQQVHLGFDLASLQQAPVPASNRGIVLYAADLGIYGNCVILDHGLGVLSLYGHLSTMDVKEGETVEKGQILGRTGITGLAGGDHLHFTILVNGIAVNPVEWWDSHWMEDRVYRKIREAGGKAPTLK